MRESYDAVIPAPVRRCKNLPPRAKELYADIRALCNERGYCWASNQRFVDLYGVNERSVQRWIKALEKERFIDIIYLPHDDGTERRIYLTEALMYYGRHEKVSGVQDEAGGRGDKNVTREGVTKMSGGGRQKCHPIKQYYSFSKEKGGDYEYIRRHLIGLFSKGYLEIRKSKLKLTPKELGSVKNLVSYFAEDREEFAKKLSLLKAVAEKHNKFQNWNYLPSQLLLHWNDLVQGCVLDEKVDTQKPSTRPPVVKAPESFAADSGK